MPSKQNKVYEADVEDNKVFAALSYIWILCLIPLLLRRKSKFAQFHARQGLVLLIFEFVVAILMWIPLFGQVLFLCALILSIVGFMKAIKGEWYELPGAYRWSKKFKF